MERNEEWSPPIVQDDGSIVWERTESIKNCDATAMQQECNNDATTMQQECDNDATDIKSVLQTQKAREMIQKKLAEKKGIDTKVSQEIEKLLMNNSFVKEATKGDYKSFRQIFDTPPKNLAMAITNEIGENITVERLRPMVYNLKLKDRVKKPLVFFYCFVSALTPTLLCLLFWLINFEFIKNEINQIQNENEPIGEFVYQKQEELSNSEIKELAKKIAQKKNFAITNYRIDLIISDCEQNKTKKFVLQAINGRINELKNKKTK